MTPLAIRMVKVACGVVVVAAFVSESVAQTTTRAKRATPRPVQSTPQLPSNAHRPNIPLEQQIWYDRNAITQTTG